MYPNPVPLRKKPIEKEGCKVKIKRDKMGKVVGYETNGKCSPKELEMLNERHVENDL